MAKQGIGDLPQRGVSPEDIAQLQQQIDSLLQLAWRLKIIPRGRSLGELRGQFWRREGRITEPKDWAARHLTQASLLLDAAAEAVSCQGDAAQYLQFAQESFSLALGYITALRDVGLKASRHGAAGRRKAGEERLEKVRKAALPHRGAMTREKAAPLIAYAVRLSSGTVLRKLSELFPGTRWDNPEDEPESDESADASRRIV